MLRDMQPAEPETLPWEEPGTAEIITLGGEWYARNAAMQFACAFLCVLLVAVFIGQGFLPRCPTFDPIEFSSAYPPPDCHDVSKDVCVAGIVCALLLWYPLYQAALFFNLRRFR